MYEDEDPVAVLFAERKERDDIAPKTAFEQGLYEKNRASHSLRSHNKLCWCDIASNLPSNPVSVLFINKKW